MSRPFIPVKRGHLCRLWHEVRRKGGVYFLRLRLLFVYIDHVCIVLKTFSKKNHSRILMVTA